MHPKRTIIEPFKIKMVEPLRFLSFEEREKVAKTAGFNLFLVPADSVTFDFLTDSGATAMSNSQWSAMMLADESYAGSKSFFKFQKKVREVTGYDHVIPTHQGRAAERILFETVVRPGSKIPSNNHFDTTRANIEKNGGEAVDLVIPEGRDASSHHPFKGNIDLPRLERFIEENAGRVPLGMATVTNNSGGGQPVSLENLRGASKIYKRHGIPFILDACRFSENACFIRMREPGQLDRKIRDIVFDMFQAADGCYLSAKKNALVNMGGFMAFKGPEWVEKLKTTLVLGEGFPTYGGLSARDIEAMTVGLEEGMDEHYLEYRLATVRYMVDRLNQMGVVTLQPPGGHAVYIDAKALLPQIPPHLFPAQSLAVALYIREGVRSCEMGSATFGKTGSEGEFVPAQAELVRLAFPRRTYTQSHFDYVLEGIEEIVRHKAEFRGFRMVSAPETLRQFGCRFEPV